MLESLEVRLGSELADAYTPQLGECISAALKSCNACRVHQPTLRSLAVFAPGSEQFELAETMFLAPGLRGLEELHLCDTGRWLLLDISHMARLTNLGLGFTEQDGGSCFGMCGVCDVFDVWDETDELDVPSSQLAYASCVPPTWGNG